MFRITYITAGFRRWWQMTR